MRRDPAAVMIHRMRTILVAISSWLRPYDQLRNVRCWRWQQTRRCTSFDELPSEVREALETASAAYVRRKPRPAGWRTAAHPRQRPTLNP